MTIKTKKALVLLPLLLLIARTATAKHPIIYKNGELELRDPAAYVSSVVHSPLPHTYLGAEDLPENWDWRNVDGKSYCSPIQNQHIETYCGSCWNFAALSSLADRLNIATQGAYPDVMPSNQVLINCGDAGNCNGGDSGMAYAWIYKNGGIPDVTCQAYEAQNRECTPENVCRNCDPSFTRFRKKRSCYAVDDYQVIKVTEYGNVTGDAAIQAEIFSRGPVACYIDATPLEDYNGGVCMYEGAGPTNHAIALVGWGTTEDGVDYWQGRNSWGSYMEGEERGWFKIVRGGAFDAGTCYWAVPSYDYTGLPSGANAEEKVETSSV